MLWLFLSLIWQRGSQKCVDTKWIFSYKKAKDNIYGKLKILDRCMAALLYAMCTIYRTHLNRNKYMTMHTMCLFTGNLLPPPQYSGGSSRECCQDLLIRHLVECSHRTAGCCGWEAREETGKQPHTYTNTYPHTYTHSCKRGEKRKCMTCIKA